MRWTLFLVYFLFCSSVEAREDIKDFLIDDARGNPKSIVVFDDGVKFYFAGQKHEEVTEDLGEIRTSKKTNAINKSDYIACEWAFLSALKALKQRAVTEGADAVVEIQSNYKNNLYSSETSYQCGVGNVIAGVALKGRLVKLK